MVKIKEAVKKLIPSRRKIIQLYFALLYNANLKGFVSGNIYKGNSKNLCVPGLNCYSCPGAVGACPLGSLQSAISSDKSTMFYMGGILMLFGVLFGRLVCGFACPFGLIQELVHKIKTPKVKKSKVTRFLSYLKYPILVIFVFVVPIAYALRDVPLPAFCKYICPSGTLEGGIGLLANKANENYFSMLGPIFTWKFMLLVSFIVGSVFVFRLFCRFFCPLGLLYGLFNRFSVFGIKLDSGKCVDCGLCVSNCKMDIKRVGDVECINCGECVGVCPTKAISWKGKVFNLPANEIGTVPEKKACKKHLVAKTAVWILMLSVLVSAIVYYWKQPDGATAPPVTDLEYGTNVGDLCYGYELEVFDSTGVTGEKINPAKTGKITIINFWGTWCTPCVNELPYFDRIAGEYEESVSVVAIHTAMAFSPAAEYVGKYYGNTKMTFAKDYTVENTEGYYSTLGGRGTYPYTVILDSEGKIRKIYYSSVEYEELKESVEAILNS